MIVAFSHFRINSFHIIMNKLPVFITFDKNTHFPMSPISLKTLLEMFIIICPVVFEQRHFKVPSWFDNFCFLFDHSILWSREPWLCFNSNLIFRGNDLFTIQICLKNINLLLLGHKFLFVNLITLIFYQNNQKLPHVRAVLKTHSYNHY